ncbi:epididymal-specific lipocalin-5-like [Peromyscus californicus insignis]|uniref:epididymal-specific lipocalin-5-like n=1 Tax=Peromyscus californicus insignis TaxID=564181 RepID=UPI0022A6FA4E|nr:epididymal-specific lipocalin-5-like [Peromyscus californicus insignis]
MESNMLFTLLGLCVGLCVGLASDLQDAELKDFNINKFLGLWYEIAFASTMDTHGLAHKEQKLGAMTVKLEENLLALTTTYYNGDHCVLEKAGAMQTDHPGKFKVTKISGSKEVAIVATDYQTYAIIDISSPVAGTVYRAMKLYSRSLNNNEKVLRKFQKVALENGFTTSNIIINKHDLTCVDILQSVSLRTKLGLCWAPRLGPLLWGQSFLLKGMDVQELFS